MGTKQDEKAKEYIAHYGKEVQAAVLRYVSLSGNALSYSMTANRNASTLKFMRQDRRDAWDALVKLCNGDNERATKATRDFIKMTVKTPPKKEQDKR